MLSVTFTDQGECVSEYYLDMETTGLDPGKDQIITIQYQRLGMVSGRTEGDLKIIKTWDSSEKEVLELFNPIFLGRGPFSFVAIGNNVPFMYTFLVERSRIHGIESPDPVYIFGSKPYLDIKPFLVLMNGGSFKGASLDRFTNLSLKGDAIPKLFYEGKFEAIEDHVREKAKEFQELYRHLKENSSSLVPDGVEGPLGYTAKGTKRWF